MVQRIGATESGIYVGRRSDARPAPAFILAALAVCCCAFCAVTWWRSHAFTMTTDQAVETIMKSPDARQRASAVASLGRDVTRLLQVLENAAAREGTEGEYARTVLRRIRDGK